MDPVNATQSYAKDFSGYNLKHKEIRRFLTHQRTYVADVDALNALATNVAMVVGVPVEFVLTLLNLEVGYPHDHSVYRSSMRGGSGGLYVGITQMYKDFWSDVRSHYKYSNELPVSHEATSLEMQLVAPFLYAERYKRGLLRQRYPFAPAVIYAAHQQGGPAVGLNSFGVKQIAGRQSGKSVKVVNEVKRFNRTKAEMAPVWL